MIKLITTGKIKEKYLKEAISEYTKRLSKYTKLEIIELNDYDFDNKNIVLEKEKEQILKHISDKDYIVTLEIEGKQFSSTEFAEKINNIFINNSNITFFLNIIMKTIRSSNNKSNI